MTHPIDEFLRLSPSICHWESTADSVKLGELVSRMLITPRTCRKKGNIKEVKARQVPIKTFFLLALKFRIYISCVVPSKWDQAHPIEDLTALFYFGVVTLKAPWSPFLSFWYFNQMLNATHCRKIIEFERNCGNPKFCTAGSEFYLSNEICAHWDNYLKTPVSMTSISQNWYIAAILKIFLHVLTFLHSRKWIARIPLPLSSY